MINTTEVENTLDGTTNRINEEEEQISELEDKMMKITAVEQSSLCYPVGPCWLSGLNIVVCVCQSFSDSEVMHGCESWTIKKAEHQRIDAFEL